MLELRTTGDLATRAFAVARELPGVAICRSTAAWLWGLDVLPPGVHERDWDVDVLAPPGLPLPRLPGIRIFAGDPGDDVAVRDGVPVTDPVRTAVDCALFFDRYPALAALDAFLRAGVSRDRVRRRFHVLAAGSPGRRQAAELIALADPRAQSPGESWARLLIIDAGLPAPVPQVAVPCAGGRFYLDLGFVRHRTAVEYDGEEHHSTPAELHHDRVRRALIRAAGWELVVVRHHEIRAWPHRFLESVYEVLLIRGWRPPDSRRLEIERNIRQIAAHARLDHGLR